jgi:hypothetical protein
MKKSPFTYASLAALYIVIIILGVTSTPYFFGKNETIFIPMAMLSLFVISAAIMGFLFVSEPILLYIDNKKEEAVKFFFQTVGFFACFAVIFGSIAICTSYL